MGACSLRWAMVILGGTAAHDWARVPVFAHTAFTDPTLTDHEVAHLTKFDMVTLEKNQGGSDPDVVSRIVAAAAQLKARKPGLPVLLYTNALMNWPQFEAVAAAFASHNATWWLRDDSGARVSMRKSGLDLPTFDMRQHGMRAAWTAQCAGAVASGVVDGCFVDRAVQYQFGCNARRAVSGGKPLLSRDACDAFAAVQAELQADIPTVLSNCGGQADAGACPPVDGVFFEFFCDLADGTAPVWPGMGPQNRTCADLVELAADAADAGKLVQVHRGVGAETNATYALACFLLAAGNRSYFGDGKWSGEWTWLSEYDNFLGPPLARYAADASDPLVLRRSFEGVDVAVDTRNAVAWLDWRA